MQNIAGSLEQQLQNIFSSDLIYLRDRYFDAIALHETGVYLFKICYYQGAIYGEASDKNWLSVYLEQKTQFNNPTRECILEAELFARDFGLRLGVLRPFIVFSQQSKLDSVGHNANHVSLFRVSQLSSLFNKCLPKRNAILSLKDMKALIYDLTIDDQEELEQLYSEPFSHKNQPSARSSTNFLEADMLNYSRPKPSQMELDRIACSKYLNEATKVNYVATFLYAAIAFIMLVGLPIESMFAVFPLLLSIRASRTAMKCELADREDNYLIQIVFVAIHLILAIMIFLPYIKWRL